MPANQQAVPSTPRVISPSPTPSEHSGKDSYFPKSGASDVGDSEHPELSRARSRSRSPGMTKKGSRKVDGLTPILEKSTLTNGHAQPTRRKPEAQAKKSNDGLLKPNGPGFGRDYWRALSRSPSPLGLIPIHREWRAFVHKHEIPRKALHVSIGFLTLTLYIHGLQRSDIHPTLLTLLIPIFLTDVIRHNYAPFNRFYIKTLGAFMRESEAHDRYNGVISYLAGVWVVMRFCSDDVAVVSVLLLSFCDTAASTFGRLYGRYTPRIRKGKSLAGSIAAFLFGIASSLLFYLYFVPRAPVSTTASGMAFSGHLSLPETLRDTFGLSKAQATITGGQALAVLSIWSGFVASASEAVDLYGLDDNLTIPILCGIGLESFLRLLQ